jgi:L-ascorbate metabolism protein UlaG (beta-lactamase superfamily)
MKIKWFGQSCFLLTSSDGVKILTDPFNKKLGYKLPEVEANIVTTSHNHFDHNYIEVVRGEYTHINEPQAFIKDNIEVIGIETFHDKTGGSKRGKNIIFKFNIDGINVCHCGDLGHVLTPDQINKIGKVDILLIPVGGTFTIDAMDAVKVMGQLKPTITIPMHYRTKALGVFGLSFGKVDKFLAAAGQQTKELKDLEMDTKGLSEYNGIVVLKYE